jgi:hypothetical protein
MPEVNGIEKLFSFVPRRKFGRHRCYGRAMFAQSVFGEDEIVFMSADKDGNPKPITLSGIYRTDNVTGKTKFYREPYYITKNPRTVPQQAQRSKFADAVAGWQALTAEEKEVYNIRARGKHLSGYNLFLKEYLLSH